MLDNRELLKNCLGELRLAPQREEEILRELGDHLADHAAALEARGVAPDDAAREALDSVSNWPEVRKEILAAENAEEIMNYRTKVLWLPGFCTFLLNASLLALLQFAGLRPHIYWLHGGLFVPFYIPWLLALPIIGAVGAFWSKRVGGGVAHQLLVSLAPLIIWLGILLLMLPISMVVDRHVPLPLKLEGLMTYIVAWWLLPSLALLLGALPFLRRLQPRPQP
jgi:hypothetical protein